MRNVFWVRPSILLIAGVLVSSTGCGRQTRSASDELPAPRGSSASNPVSPSASRAAGSTVEKRAELLRRIRAADPQEATIQRALINEENELGLVLSRQTNLDDVPKLARAMLAEMDRAFPGENHTVVAYAPTNPPRKIGTARLDSRTRDMTYTPASP
jgi:hypothetical protein